MVSKAVKRGEGIRADRRYSRDTRSRAPCKPCRSRPSRIEAVQQTDPEDEKRKEGRK